MPTNFPSRASKEREVCCLGPCEREAFRCSRRRSFSGIPDVKTSIGTKRVAGNRPAGMELPAVNFAPRPHGMEGMRNHAGASTAPGSNILPRPQCSSGTSQSRPYPARPMKVKASAGQCAQSATRHGESRQEESSAPRQGPGCRTILAVNNPDTD